MITNAGNAVLLAIAVLMGLSAAEARAAGSEEAFTYSNPLDFKYDQGQTAERREVRDPCIIREGDTYYLVFTMWPFSNRDERRLSEPNEGGSPGMALYSSKDLKNWAFENWLVKSSDLPDDCPYKNRFWAPRSTRSVESSTSFSQRITGSMANSTSRENGVRRDTRLSGSRTR